ncbi:MAG TPA: YcgN family cysteine cluster protein [Bauldia sp.]|nr:YcgN family cysteine cluster protein [Bauldia sp.]
MPTGNGPPVKQKARNSEDVPFWRRLSLEEMSSEEWESLCDGCGRCCLNKLEDWDSGEISWTDIACRLFDDTTCRCTDYPNRSQRIPDCETLTPEKVRSLTWLPPTCAYRLVAEGRDLYWWHPLVSGDPDTVHLAGISARHRTRSEEGIPTDQFEDYVVDWPGEDPARKIELSQRGRAAKKQGAGRWPKR